MKKCTDCSLEKPIEEFATRSSMCKPCHNAYTRRHYRENKKYYVDKARKRNREVIAANRALLQEHLRNNPCVDCGNSDIEVLEFDHRDRTEKSSEVCRFITSSSERLFEEVAKCDVRCANCHVKRTRRQRGWWTDK